MLVSAEARRMLVKRGRQRVVQFTRQRTASNLFGLFEEVLAERRRAVRASPPAPALPLARPVLPSTAPEPSSVFRRGEDRAL